MPKVMPVSRAPTISFPKSSPPVPLNSSLDSMKNEPPPWVPSMATHRDAHLRAELSSTQSGRALCPSNLRSNHRLRGGLHKLPFARRLSEINSRLVSLWVGSPLASRDL